MLGGSQKFLPFYPSLSLLILAKMNAIDANSLLQLRWINFTFLWELLPNTSSSGWLSTGILEREEGRSLGKAQVPVRFPTWSSSAKSKFFIMNFPIFSMHTLELCLLLLFRPVGKRGEELLWSSRWLFTKICSEIHNKMIRKDSAQCDCSSKWKEGADSWWGAGLFPFLFLCKASWMFWSGFLWLSNTGIEFSD